MAGLIQMADGRWQMADCLALTFYGLTIWIVVIGVVLFLLLVAFIRIDSHVERRRLDRMMREADAKRDARTPDFQIRKAGKQDTPENSFSGTEGSSFPHSK